MAEIVPTRFASFPISVPSRTRGSHWRHTGTSLTTGAESRVFEWINAAQSNNRAWARNALARFAVLLILLWLASWMGLP
jgi:hypothetical protein